jgi:O-antigen/teichoic acid export membrane protein
MFVAIGNIIYPLASIGMPAFINKFYPYYKHHLAPEKNDIMGFAFLLCGAACLLVLLGGFVIRPLVSQKFSSDSPLLVHYYAWLFPFGLGLSFLYVLEAYGWQVKRSILTNFLRELLWRLLNTVLIFLFFFGILGSFDGFIKLYSLNYAVVAIVLCFFLLRKKELHLVFSISRVTKRFFSRIRSLVLLAWSANVLLNLSMYFAQLVIAAVVAGGLTPVAVFTMGQFVASLITAPQRGVAAAAIAPLSQAWRDKNHARIERIYRRSATNLLIFGVGIFVLIAINFRDGILLFGLPKAYLAGESIFLLIGLNRVFDMGTGLNTQIIGTSVAWRFDFFTGMVLVTLTIPLNYILAKHYGIVGPAIADLATFSIYNTIRCIFLYRKYGFQPFGRGTLYTVITGAVLYAACRWLFGAHSGLLWISIRSCFFAVLYGGAVLALRLSEDVNPVWQTIRKRLGLRSDGTR